MVRIIAPLGLALALASTACGPTVPPANWARGGAPLEIPRARLVRAGGLIVDIMPDGRILFDGHHALTLDVAGRLYEAEDADPLALLEADGRVTGEGNAALGVVGSNGAARAGEEHAWITLTPAGEVIRYDEDGEPKTYGAWLGCNVSARTRHACAYVTHVVTLRYPDAPGMGPGAGYGPSFGISVGVPFGR